MWKDPDHCEQCHLGMVVMELKQSGLSCAPPWPVLQLLSLGFCPNFPLQGTLSCKMKETLSTPIVFRHGIYQGNKAPTKTPVMASSAVFPGSHFS